MLNSPVYTLFLAIYTQLRIECYENFGGHLKKTVKEWEDKDWTDVDGFVKELRRSFEAIEDDEKKMNANTAINLSIKEQLEYYTNNEERLEMLHTNAVPIACYFNDTVTLSDLLLKYRIVCTLWDPEFIIKWLYNAKYISILRLLRLTEFDFSSASAEIMEAIDGCDTKPAICI